MESNLNQQSISAKHFLLFSSSLPLSRKRQNFASVDDARVVGETYNRFAIWAFHRLLARYSSWRGSRLAVRPQLAAALLLRLLLDFVCLQAFQIDLLHGFDLDLSGATA